RSTSWPSWSSRVCISDSGGSKGSRGSQGSQGSRGSRGNLVNLVNLLWLFPDVETLDQVGVALRVLGLEVVEQPAAAPDEHQQAAAGVVILCVRFEMFRQVVDALAENRDLDFWWSRVGLMRLV